MAENERYEYVALDLLKMRGTEAFVLGDLHHPAEPDGTPWSEESVYELFPHLAAKYS